MRFVAGVNLLLAAVLKAWSPAEAATLESVYGLPEWFSVVLMPAEWTLGVLLLAGWWPRWTTPVGAVVFTAFAAFSLYRAVSGAESCGCFGAVTVNPWFTFVLDLMIAAGLFLSWWRLDSEQPTCGDQCSTVNWRAGGIGALAVVPLVAWSVHSAPTRLVADSTLPETGGLVVLEPETWIGKAFPLTPYIEINVDWQTGMSAPRDSASRLLTPRLANGDWILLLYHHDCPKCQEALPAYEELAATAVETGLNMNVLLVEVSPYGDVKAMHSAAIHARLSDDREWFVQAPVEIRLRDGQVVEASHELPAIAIHHENRTLARGG